MLGSAAVDRREKSRPREPVDAVVIDIIAAEIGSLAGAKDRAVLKEDGTVGK
ncbi:MAG TPA: hypothetical protein VN823_23720 [Stellaceae bacterium]|nr:hypothetical protein [Stellaceae bacterium]